jgi:dTDP-4-amino-4,6-dideoxyglucose
VADLPIVRPHHPPLSHFKVALSDALKSGRVTNNGRWVQLFERRLSEVLGSPTIVFNNATSALIAMLRACDVEGSKIICPSFTFAATPHSIVMAGASPVFADIEPDTLCLDNEDVNAAIKAADGPVSAILGADPYGICWEPPVRKGVDTLIDAAPSFGSMVAGRQPSKRGRAQVFSFHATKPFSTTEGGALCSDDLDLIERARAIRNFGQDTAGDCKHIGFNGKMNEFCALVGVMQLEHFTVRSAQRAESASRLRRGLQGIRGLRVQGAPARQSPIWTYRPIFIEPSFGVPRDDVVYKLRQRGIGVRTYYTPCHKLSCYVSRETKRKTLPVTEGLARQVIALPVYDDMDDAQIERIAKAFQEIRMGK